MPVAIRKRSWEEHVTHPSGLQYSFDDLDLVCCHGVGSEGPWMGAGASKQEQQCISISSNNGLPLSESAGEQPGKLPNHQETKESHTEGYSRPPEISEATLNQSSAAELEPQTDLPDVGEERISTPEHAGVNVNVPVSVRQSSLDMMEVGDVMSPVNKTVEPAVTLVVEGERDQGVTESWSADSADNGDTFCLLFIFIQREHARLDSMVLLLMKLDQLDQEIENALSATCSMDNTPTLHRRQLLVHTCMLPVVFTANQKLTCMHSSIFYVSRPAPDLGAKPKSGVSQELCIISEYISTRHEVRY
uniref:DLC1 Rho GTPase activating protein n=1 Tax=Lates calcarifer TaxID=8187 RepID=A0A4W6BZ32_LATCA